MSLKAGDQKPILRAALRRGRVRDDAVDLTDAEEVRLYVQNADTGDLLINQTVDIVDESEGLVEYQFGDGDTVQGGRNELEIVVTWPTDRPESFPKQGYGVIQVNEPLGRELDPADIDDPDISVTILNVDTLRANTGSSVSVEDDLQFNSNDATGIGSLGVEQVDIDTYDAVYYVGTEQTISNNTTTTIEYDAVEGSDPIGSMDGSFNWSPDQSGTYRVRAVARIQQPSADGLLRTTLTGTGIQQRNEYRHFLGGISQPVSGACEFTFEMGTGDDIQATMLTISGSSETLDDGQNTSYIGISKEA
jgi:hypothetical protein